MDLKDIRVGRTYKGRDGKIRRIPVLGNHAPFAPHDNILWEPVQGWAPTSRGGYMNARALAQWAVEDVTREKV